MYMYIIMCVYIYTRIIKYHNVSLPQDVLALGGSEISRLPELFEVFPMGPLGVLKKDAVSIS